MFILNLIVLAAGFYALIKGADIFVDGSAALAGNFRVPALVIGLTIVALGTSAPELAVSISAALQGSNEIAVSNVVGSNIFNLLCVLGVCAVICPIPVDKKIVKRDFPIALGSTLFVLFTAGGVGIFDRRLAGKGVEEIAGTVSRLAGVMRAAAFLGYIVCLVHDARKLRTQKRRENTDPRGNVFCASFWA